MPNRRPDHDKLASWEDVPPAEMLRRLDVAVETGAATPDEVETQRAIYRRALERERESDNREERSDGI